MIFVSFWFISEVLKNKMMGFLLFFGFQIVCFERLWFSKFDYNMSFGGHPKMRLRVISVFWDAENGAYDRGGSSPFFCQNLGYENARAPIFVTDFTSDIVVLQIVTVIRDLEGC